MEAPALEPNMDDTMLDTGLRTRPPEMSLCTAGVGLLKGVAMTTGGLAGTGVGRPELAEVASGESARSPSCMVTKKNGIGQNKVKRRVRVQKVASYLIVSCFFSPICFREKKYKNKKRMRTQTHAHVRGTEAWALRNTPNYNFSRSLALLQ